MTPKSTPVRPRAASGFLASSGHLWTCHFYDFWCQNGSQNYLKMTQSSPQWCPGPSKFRTFPQKVALGASWFQLSFSENPFDVILGASGPILAILLLVFWILSQACAFFPKTWGGEGGESITFKITLFSIKPFFTTTTSDWHGADLLCNLDKECLNPNRQSNCS